MRKNYVLDTNILITTAGKAIRGFDDNIVTITYTTLEELDGLKSSPGETGYEAREAIRCINSIIDKPEIQKDHLDSSWYIPMENKGVLRIEQDGIDAELLPVGWDLKKPDNKIISTVLSISKRGKETVILVTNDISMKIKAESVGINTQVYLNEQVGTENEYTGRKDILLESEQSLGIIDKLYHENLINVQDIPEFQNITENQYLVIKNGQGSSALGFYKNNQIELVLQNNKIYGITGKNAAQRFALHALSAPAKQLPLVILKGPAGSGKTLLSMAVGLDKAYETKKEDGYSQVVIMRSNTLSDNDQGYLKGTLEDKMMPLLAPYFDNLEYLCRENIGSYKDAKIAINDILESGLLTIGCFAYIRGRSYNDTYLVVDEAQNITRNQAKTLVTRVGMNTKLIVMGDPNQIDNPKLDRKNNGLVYLSEIFKGSSLCAQVTFDESECVRSPLASEALSRL